MQKSQFNKYNIIKLALGQLTAKNIQMKEYQKLKNNYPNTFQNRLLINSSPIIKKWSDGSNRSSSTELTSRVAAFELAYAISHNKPISILEYKKIIKKAGSPYHFDLFLNDEVIQYTLIELIYRYGHSKKEAIDLLIRDYDKIKTTLLRNSNNEAFKKWLRNYGNGENMVQSVVFVPNKTKMNAKYDPNN